jgi:hypothetical protein
MPEIVFWHLIYDGVQVMKAEDSDDKCPWIWSK